MRLHHQPEAAQRTEQLAVPERLAAAGEAGPPRLLLQQRVRGVRLQESGLLVVAVAVDHAVGAAERAGGVHGVERLVDTGVLARRHLVHHLGRGGGERGVAVVGVHVLGGLDRGGHDLRDAEHQRPVEHAAEHLAVRHARVALEPHRVGGTSPRQRQRQLVLAGDGQLVEPGLGVPLLVGVLLEVVGLRQRGVDQDRQGRGDGRAATPEHRDVEGVEARASPGRAGRRSPRWCTSARRPGPAAGPRPRSRRRTSRRR